MATSSKPYMSPWGYSSAALYLQNLVDLETMHLKDTRIATSILTAKQWFYCENSARRTCPQITFFHMHEDCNRLLILEFKVIVQIVRTECLLKGGREKKKMKQTLMD